MAMGSLRGILKILGGENGSRLTGIQGLYKETRRPGASLRLQASIAHADAGSPNFVEEET